jgi:hypothetical protein
LQEIKEDGVADTVKTGGSVIVEAGEDVTQPLMSVTVTK